MPRTGNLYPAEFGEQIVALADSGRSVEELAREFEPCAATIHGWIKQADRDVGRRIDGLTSQSLPAVAECPSLAIAHQVFRSSSI